MCGEKARFDFSWCARSRAHTPTRTHAKSHKIHLNAERMICVRAGARSCVLYMRTPWHFVDAGIFMDLFFKTGLTNGSAPVYEDSINQTGWHR